MMLAARSSSPILPRMGRLGLVTVSSCAASGPRLRSGARSAADGGYVVYSDISVNGIYRYMRRRR